MQYLDICFHYRVEISQRRTMQIYDTLDNIGERAGRNETMIYMIFYQRQSASSFLNFPNEANPFVIDYSRWH